MHTDRAIFLKIRALFVYFQKRQEKSPTLPFSSCTPKLIYFLKRGWYSTNFFFMTMPNFSKIHFWVSKIELHLASSCHNGVIDNDKNWHRMWAYQSKICRSRKHFAFSHLKCTKVNDNFMREKDNSALVLLIL